MKKSGHTEENLSKKYNSLIIEAHQNFPLNCRQLLQEASDLIPNKPEPYLFLAFERVQNNLEKQSDDKE